LHAGALRAYFDISNDLRASTYCPSKPTGEKNGEIFLSYFFLKCPLFDRVPVEAPASIIASSSFTIGSKASIKDSLAVIKKLSLQDSICD
jgi:hypothetical protein